jgi:hypothetical protein
MLAKAPKILHISCHGIPSRVSPNSIHAQNDGDSLLFEHETQVGEFISEKMLKNLIRDVWNTELVFLAACDSEFAAKIFLQKGVRHIICIEHHKEVLDKAILTFSDTFYRAVFDGNPICGAFEIAQKLTSNIHREKEA